jgi:hypothetical protein
MAHTSYDIVSSWPRDTMAAAEIGDRFLDLLRGLSSLGPPMSNWLLIDPSAPRWVAPAETAADMARFVARSTSRDDDGQPDPRDGYGILAKGSKVPSEFGAADSVDINIKVGGQWDNRLSLEFGSFQSPADPDLVTYPVFRGAVEAMAAAWPCPWVLGFVWTPEDAPLVPWDGVTPLWPRRGPPPKYRAPFEVAWVAYLSASLARGLTPPAGLLCEPTPGGGVILSSVLERLDESNADHMRRARQLEAILNERIGLQGSDPVQRVEHPVRVGSY